MVKIKKRNKSKNTSSTSVRVRKLGNCLIITLPASIVREAEISAGDNIVFDTNYLSRDGSISLSLEK